MTDIARKVNIQVFNGGVQLSLVNGYNTDRMSTDELDVLLSDVLLAKNGIADSKRPKLRVANS